MQLFPRIGVYFRSQTEYRDLRHTSPILAWDGVRKRLVKSHGLPFRPLLLRAGLFFHFNRAWE